MCSEARREYDRTPKFPAVIAHSCAPVVASLDFRRAAEAWDSLGGRSGRGRHQAPRTRPSAPASASRNPASPGSALHEAKTMDLLFPIAGVPKARCAWIGLDNDGLQSNSPHCREVGFGLVEQSASQSPTAIRWGDHQPVDGSPPTIPAGNHRADQLMFVFGNDQRRRVPHDEIAQALSVVGVGGFGSGCRPKCQHRLDIGKLTCSDRHVHSQMLRGRRRHPSGPTGDDCRFDGLVLEFAADIHHGLVERDSHSKCETGKCVALSALRWAAGSMERRTAIRSSLRCLIELRSANASCQSNASARRVSPTRCRAIRTASIRPAAATLATRPLRFP